MDNSTANQQQEKIHVKARKDQALKIRLQTLIKERGMSEPQFFRKLELSRQYWYFISWGIWNCPDWLKVKIAGN